MSDNIKGYLTSIGATIIAKEIAETDEYYEVENALFINQTNEHGNVTVGFNPITILESGDFTKGMKAKLRKTAVLLTHGLRDDLVKNYSQTVGVITIENASSLVGLRK